MAAVTRWERLLESKPVPLLEHLLGEVARLLAADLAAWPPRVEDFDPLTGQRLQALLADHPQRPGEALYREAFKLTRWDLGREQDAYDEYLRNQGWHAAGLTAMDRPMLLFLSRLMAEHLLALGEQTEGRVTRARMLQVLAGAERHLFARGDA